jgi:hypothetical protein
MLIIIIILCQWQTPGEHDHVNFHFISFLNIDNHVWSLDGMRAQPTNRGATSQETFLKVHGAPPPRPGHVADALMPPGHRTARRLSRPSGWRRTRKRSCSL